MAVSFYSTVLKKMHEPFVYSNLDLMTLDRSQAFSQTFFITSKLKLHFSSNDCRSYLIYIVAPLTELFFFLSRTLCKKFRNFLLLQTDRLSEQVSTINLSQKPCQHSSQSPGLPSEVHRAFPSNQHHNQQDWMLIHS